MKLGKKKFQVKIVIYSILLGKYLKTFATDVEAKPPANNTTKCQLVSHKRRIMLNLTKIFDKTFIATKSRGKKAQIEM